MKDEYSQQDVIAHIDELRRETRAELASLRAAIARKKRGTGTIKAAISIAVVIAVAMPALVLASDRFPDVASSNVHHDNINAIADAGISLGCGGGNYCPGDFVRRDQMASFLARGLALAPGQVPVANARSSFHTYCKLATDRPRSFPQEPCQGSSRTAVDAAGIVGEYTSLAIGTDGNPVVSYFDRTNRDLKVAKCATPTCTGPAAITAVDTVDDVGRYTSLAIGTDGNPVVSYYDNTNGDLKVAKCANPACTGAATLAAVDNVVPFGFVGLYTSVAIGTDGNPVISYYDSTNGDLKVAKCANPSCTGTATLTAVDTADTVGEFTSLAIGPDGNPVISYRDTTNGDLKVAKCANPACTGAGTITAVDTAGSVGQSTSLAIGPDGNPVISYYDSTNLDLKVAKCANPTCTGAATITAVDTAGNVGEFTSIAIGTDSNPVISYFDTGDLEVAKCPNPACTGVATMTAVDTAGIVGEWNSIAIGTDGNPVVSYFAVTNDDLKVARPPVNM